MVLETQMHSQTAPTPPKGRPGDVLAAIQAAVACLSHIVRLHAPCMHSICILVFRYRTKWTELVGASSMPLHAASQGLRLSSLHVMKPMMLLM